MGNIYVFMKEWVETTMWIFIASFIFFQISCFLWLIVWFLNETIFKIKFSYEWEYKFEKIGIFFNKMYKYITWIGGSFIGVYIILLAIDYLLKRFS